MCEKGRLTMKSGLCDLPWLYWQPKQVNKPLNAALEDRDTCQIKATIHIINNARQSCRRIEERILLEASCRIGARTQK